MEIEIGATAADKLGEQLLEGSSKTAFIFSGTNHKPPGDVAKLIGKENAAERDHGPSLSGQEKAHLTAWRAFPDSQDQQYRELQEKHLLAEEHLGSPLSLQEQAKLKSKFVFPNPSDYQYRELKEKDLLAEEHLGPPLSLQEQAKLKSKLEFRDPSDERYREIAERLNLYGHHLGAMPSEAELSELQQGYDALRQRQRAQGYSEEKIPWTPWTHGK